MIRITSVFDNSGYGIAATNTAIVLLNNGIKFCTNIIQTPMSRFEFAKSKNNDIIFSLIDNKEKVDINIAITIPSLTNYSFKKNTYNILYMFWETDRICNDWINIINNGLCNEIWVSCGSNYKALINSGIKKPIYIIPQYIKTYIITKEQSRDILPLPNNKLYTFYSIFQWTDRKNPEGLIRAYYKEFKENDNVMLVLKTYGASAFADKRKIKEKILELKLHSGNNNPCPIYFIGDLLKPEQINAIHPQCNAYVHCGRGEGLNIPLIEAMKYGKQIITTKLGGIADWIDETSGYIIPHELVEINFNNMPWGSFYQSLPAQKWGDIKDEDIQIVMRQAYEERFNYKNRIDKYNGILSRCDEKEMFSKMKERLDKIIKK